MFLVDIYLSLMMLKLAQQDFEAAQKAIWEAKRLAQNNKLYRADSYNVDAYQARLWIEKGDLDASKRWASERELSILAVLEELDESQPASAYARRQERRWAEYTTLARLLIVLGEADDALVLLDKLLNRAERLGLVDRVIGTQVLSALALHTIGDVSRSTLSLKNALSLAEPQGYVRVFVDEGKPIADMLCRIGSEGFASEYVNKLVSAFDLPVTETQETTSKVILHPLIDPLSGRELEVLRLLGTNLSAPEIAEELYIAVSTVRSHIKNIYAKLGVHRRREAVNRAKELRII
jgi:LuxR family maltose regulon positive regulatory protein